MTKLGTGSATTTAPAKRCSRQYGWTVFRSAYLQERVRVSSLTTWKLMHLARHDRLLIQYGTFRSGIGTSWVRRSVIHSQARILTMTVLGSSLTCASRGSNTTAPP